MLAIKDCIYRFIVVPALCRSFLDRPEFQRLRRIKQLGFVHYVYPGAMHSRFEHCLGVMHLAGLVCDHLAPALSPREKELVQLAGMLHDVGHMAFSHLLDAFLKKSGICSDHELRSVQLLTTMNQELRSLTSEEELMVRNMILGEVPPDHPKPFLFEIVHAKKTGLDCDRSDYLQRDAFHTGLPGFQSDYIIQSMLLDEGGHIGFAAKCRVEIADLLLTRQRMFANVYCHPTVRKIDALLTLALEEANLVTPAKLQNGEWVDLDDTMVDCHLRTNAQTRPYMLAIDSRQFNPDNSFERHELDTEAVLQALEQVRWHHKTSGWRM
jgi:HD superfamily phosphohydrolase